MMGVMVTCSRNQEARCTSEVSQLLDKALEELGTCPQATSADSAAPSTSFADEIAKEVAELKNASTRQYQAIGMGELSCMVFIKTLPSLGDPVSLIGNLFRKSDVGAVNAAR
jgi:hypothetical protein